ncbi:MAG: Gfo/Idh/MocA family oxidoreductase [Actinobacteria bacterium]|nr:MAG: Gfo/Idh/MocA family oxidoreductase [Actinomycetota bacterium]
MRIGILSTARINHSILTAASSTDAAEVVAVGSRDLGRALEYAREHGLERAHGSYEALLDDPAVDAVYVSLPNSLHAEWSRRALEAGKHVLCEKPLGRRPDDVERAFEVAAERGLVLMEAFMYRHHPQTHALVQCIASGRIGELRQLRTSFTSTLEDPDDVRLRPELDGGALMDLGCYCVDVARLLAGEPEVVFGRQRLAPTGVDVGFTGVLAFANDVFAEFHCAFDLPAESGLEAIGAAGRVLVREPFTCSDPHLELNGERIDVDDANRYQLQLENFAAAARGDAEPLLGRDDGVAQARTVDALYRSAMTGAGVSL